MRILYHVENEKPPYQAWAESDHVPAPGDDVTFRMEHVPGETVEHCCRVKARTWIQDAEMVSGVEISLEYICTHTEVRTGEGPPLHYRLEEDQLPDFPGG